MSAGRRDNATRATRQAIEPVRRHAVANARRLGRVR